MNTTTNVPTVVPPPANLAEPPPTIPEVKAGNSSLRDPVTGAQVVRSSQTLGLGILPSIKLCYVNLSWSPLLSMFFYSLLIVALALGLGIDGPIHALSAAMDALIKDTNQFKFVVAIAKFLNLILLHLLKPSYLKLFTIIALFWIPYFAKPSSKNFKVVIGLTLTVFFFLDMNYFDWVLLTQLWFLYVEIRDPTYKTGIMWAIIGYYILSSMPITDTLLEDARKELTVQKTKADHNQTIKLPVDIKDIESDPILSRQSRDNNNLNVVDSNESNLHNVEESIVQGSRHRELRDLRKKRNKRNIKTHSNAILRDYFNR